MSILIKGLFEKDMPMPQDGYVDIRIHFKNGKLKRVTMPTGEDPFYATFDVEKLPQHGRLIDADKLANETFYGATSAPYITYRKFVNAPTVIEAEGSET